MWGAGITGGSLPAVPQCQPFYFSFSFNNCLLRDGYFEKCLGILETSCNFCFGEAEIVSSHLLAHTPDAHNGRGWAGPKQEPRTQCRSPVAVAGTQLESCLLCEQETNKPDTKPKHSCVG